MNTHEANISGTLRKKQTTASRIKATNDYIRDQAEHFARLEAVQHKLTTKQFKAIKCLIIKLLRASNR